MSKSEKGNKYIVIEKGIDFRTVASLMSNLGFEMNHATARNNFSSAMKSLIENIVAEIKATDEGVSTEDVELILKNQQVYNAFPEILYKANKLLINEHSNKKTPPVATCKNKLMRFSKGKGK